MTLKFVYYVKDHFYVMIFTNTFLQIDNLAIVDTISAYE